MSRSTKLLSHTRTIHKQVKVLVRGEVVSVDSGVKELILALNQLPGIETYYSCQGEQYGEGYVAFGGEAAIFLIAEMTMEVFRQERIWKRRHCHVCRGCKGMSVHLEICGGGICLRWSPWDYRRLLQMVGRVSRAFTIIEQTAIDRNTSVTSQSRKHRDYDRTPGKRVRPGTDELIKSRQ